MDKSYTHLFPEDDLPKKKKRNGRRIGRLLVIVLSVFLLVGAGIGTYAVLKPPSLGRAVRRTANDLAGTDSLISFFNSLIEGSRASGAEVSLAGDVPAELTGAEGLTFELEVQTSQENDPAARYELTLTSGELSPVSLTLYDTAEA